MLSILRTPFEQEQIYLGMLERRERIGEERGEERGITMGERKTRIETAREMLAGGELSVDTIARYTN